MRVTNPPAKPHNAPMPNASYERAKAKREQIMTILGWRCAACGATENLTLDHIKPLNKAHRPDGYVARQWEYVKQYRQGNIQILCETCQTTKGKHSQEYLMAQVSR